MSLPSNGVSGAAVLSPARPWTDPLLGSLFLDAEGVAEIRQSINIENKKSIYEHIPPPGSKKGLLKPPNHVLAGKDVDTTLSNIVLWNMMSQDEQKRELEKFKNLPRKQKDSLLKHVKSVNPNPKPPKERVLRPIQNLTNRPRSSEADEADCNSVVSTSSPPRQRQRTEADEASLFRHVGMFSMQEERDTLLVQASTKRKYHPWRVGVPAKTVRNDVPSQLAVDDLLLRFARTLTTIKTEEMLDSSSLELNNTLVLLHYTSIKESNSDGSRASHSDMRLEQPVLRVATVGPAESKAVMELYALLTSPSVREEDHPNCKLVYVCKEKELKYTETVQRLIALRKQVRARPSQKTRSVEDIMNSMPASKYLLSIHLFIFLHIYLMQMLLSSLHYSKSSNQPSVGLDIIDYVSPNICAKSTAFAPAAAVVSVSVVAVCRYFVE
jgi:hypothetical protein